MATQRPRLPRPWCLFCNDVLISTFLHNFGINSPKITPNYTKKMKNKQEKGFTLSQEVLVGNKRKSFNFLVVIVAFVSWPREITCHQGLLTEMDVCLHSFYPALFQSRCAKSGRLWETALVLDFVWGFCTKAFNKNIAESYCDPQSIEALWGVQEHQGDSGENIAHGGPFLHRFQTSAIIVGQSE